LFGEELNDDTGYRLQSFGLPVQVVFPVVFTQAVVLQSLHESLLRSCLSWFLLLLWRCLWLLVFVRSLPFASHVLGTIPSVVFGWLVLAGLPVASGLLSRSEILLLGLSLVLSLRINLLRSLIWLLFFVLAFLLWALADLTLAVFIKGIVHFRCVTCYFISEVEQHVGAVL
jgi:hypothetical protein